MVWTAWCGLPRFLGSPVWQQDSGFLRQRCESGNCTDRSILDLKGGHDPAQANHCPSPSQYRSSRSRSIHQTPMIAQRDASGRSPFRFFGGCCLGRLVYMRYWAIRTSEFQTRTFRIAEDSTPDPGFFFWGIRSLKHSAAKPRGRWGRYRTDPPGCVKL